MSNTRRSVILSAIFAALSALLLWGWFFDGKALGLNVPIAVALFYAAILFSVRGQGCSLTRGHNWLLLLLNAAFCATFALYNNSWLLFLNALAILTLTALQICLMLDLCTYSDFKNLAYDVFHGIFVRPFSRIGGAYKEVFSSKKGEHRRVLPGVLLGLAIALPIAALLVLLLSSADAVFSKMLSQLFESFSVGNVLLYILLFFGIFTLAGSFVYSLADRSRRVVSTAAAPAKEPAKYNLIPFYVILTCMSVILAVFSAIQLLYLFGGCALPSGVTYAQYARSGFFQLFIAAILVFAAVAITIKLLPDRNTLVKVLLTIMTIGIFIMLASTFMRLVMYEKEFMFTRMRLYVQGFTVMLFVVTALVTVVIWRRTFALGKPIFMVSMVFLLALSYFNIDGFIGQKNASVFTQETINIDNDKQRLALAYLLTLSEDAAPYYLPKIDPAALNKMAYNEDDYYGSDTSDTLDALILKVHTICKNGEALGDFRYWNLSRSKAAAALTSEVTDNAAKLYEKYDLWRHEGLRGWYYGY